MYAYLRSKVLAGLLAWVRWIAPPVRNVFVERALSLVKRQDELMVGAGFGEAKRHQVYARLIKEYPDASKRQLSRAIEDALEG